MLILSPLGSQTTMIILFKGRASVVCDFEIRDSLHAALKARAAHVALVAIVIADNRTHSH